MVFFVGVLAVWMSIASLSVEEKAARVLMPSIRDQEAAEVLEKVPVGGVTLFAWANDLRTQESLRKSVEALQDKSRVSLLVSIDQEGGTRATRLQPPSFLKTESAQEVAQGGATAVFAQAKAVGRELADLGIHINLAPVVDIQSPSMHGVIGDRSFGSDPSSVVSMAQAAVDGYHAGGVACALKHFPGHDVPADSHEAVPLLGKSLPELEARDLRPYREVKGADIVMMGHLLVPAFDEGATSSLSSKTITYLRKKIEFEGVIATDSLIMEGARLAIDSSGAKTLRPLGEVAVQALQAGADLLLLGGQDLTVKDVVAVHQAIVGAVQQGQLPVSRLDDAIARIDALRERYCR